MNRPNRPSPLTWAPDASTFTPTMAFGVYAMAAKLTQTLFGPTAMCGWSAAKRSLRDRGLSAGSRTLAGLASTGRWCAVLALRPGTFHGVGMISVTLVNVSPPSVDTAITGSKSGLTR